MTKEKRTSKEPVLDFGLSFGGLLSELGNFTKDIATMVEEGKTEMNKTGEISFDKARNLKGMYGISVKLGGDGMPKIDTFGRRPHDDSREPIVDIFDEGKQVQVVIELPGVDESDIKYTVKGTTLAIRGGKSERKYFKEVDLGSAVKSSPKAHYTNGILELIFEKE